MKKSPLYKQNTGLSTTPSRSSRRSSGKEESFDLRGEEGPSNSGPNQTDGPYHKPGGNHPSKKLLKMVPKGEIPRLFADDAVDKALSTASEYGPRIPKEWWPVFEILQYSNPKEIFSFLQGQVPNMPVEPPKRTVVMRGQRRASEPVKTVVTSALNMIDIVGELAETVSRRAMREAKRVAGKIAVTRVQTHIDEKVDAMMRESVMEVQAQKIASETIPNLVKNAVEYVEIVERKFAVDAVARITSFQVKKVAESEAMYVENLIASALTSGRALVSEEKYLKDEEALQTSARDIAMVAVQNARLKADLKSRSRKKFISRINLEREKKKQSILMKSNIGEQIHQMYQQETALSALLEKSMYVSRVIARRGRKDIDGFIRVSMGDDPESDYVAQMKRKDGVYFSLYYKRTPSQPPITGIKIIFEHLGERCPPGWEKNEDNLADNTETRGVYLCTTTGPGRPYLTVDLICRDSGDEVQPGFYAVPRDLDEGEGNRGVYICYKPVRDIFGLPEIVDSVNAADIIETRYLYTDRFFRQMRSRNEFDLQLAATKAARVLRLEKKSDFWMHWLIDLYLFDKLPKKWKRVAWVNGECVYSNGREISFDHPQRMEFLFAISRMKERMSEASEGLKSVALFRSECSAEVFASFLENLGLTPQEATDEQLWFVVDFCKSTVPPEWELKKLPVMHSQDADAYENKATGEIMVQNPLTRYYKFMLNLGKRHYRMHMALRKRSAKVSMTDAATVVQRVFRGFRVRKVTSYFHKKRGSIEFMLRAADLHPGAYGLLRRNVDKVWRPAGSKRSQKITEKSPEFVFGRNIQAEEPADESPDEESEESLSESESEDEEQDMIEQAQLMAELSTKDNDLERKRIEDEIKQKLLEKRERREAREAKIKRIEESRQKKLEAGESADRRIPHFVEFMRTTVKRYRDEAGLPHDWGGMHNQTKKNTGNTSPTQRRLAEYHAQQRMEEEYEEEIEGLKSRNSTKSAYAHLTRHFKGHDVAKHLAPRMERKSRYKLFKEMDSVIEELEKIRTDRAARDAKALGQRHGPNSPINRGHERVSESRYKQLRELYLPEVKGANMSTNSSLRGYFGQASRFLVAAENSVGGRPSTAPAHGRKSSVGGS